MVPNNLTPAELYQNALRTLNEARDEYRDKEKYIDDLVVKVQQQQQKINELENQKQTYLNDLEQKVNSLTAQSQEVWNIQVEQLKQKIEKYEAKIAEIDSLRVAIENAQRTVHHAQDVANQAVNLANDAQHSAKHAIDRANGFKVETGKFFKHLSSHPMRWPTSGVHSPRISEELITFTPGKFINTPQIMLGLADLDTWSKVRVKLYYTNVTPIGFKIIFETWTDETIWDGLGCYWLAFSQE